MSVLLRATPGLVLVLGLPGILVILISRVRLTWVQALGAIPVCSIGVLWLLGELSLITGAPFAPLAFWVLIAGLTVAVAATFASTSWHVSELRFEVDDSASKGVRADASLEPTIGGDRFRIWLALGLLAVAVVLGGSIWLRGGIAGSALTPPYPDATNNGFAIARIMHTHSLAANDVLVSDLRFGTTGASYYPLAMHAPLALAASITGASVASLLIGISVLFGAVVLPLGLFALTRMLVPDLPLAAGFAALLSQILGAFPYTPYTWGGTATIVSGAVLPIVLVLVFRSVTTAWSRRAAALSALMVMALFALYISVFVFLGFLLGLLLLERAWIVRDVRRVIAPMKRLATIVATALVLALPVVLSLAHGIYERTGSTPATVEPVPAAVGQVLTIAYFTPPAPWLAALAGLGIAAMLWRRRLAAWAAATGVVCYLAVLAATSHGPISQALTLPWYHQAGRVVLDLVYFVPVFAAVVLALFCNALISVLSPSRVWSVTGSVCVTLVLIGVLFGNGAQRADREFLQASYKADALIGTQQVAAFKYLSQHAPKQGLVVVDNLVDEAQWMYAYSGVKPLWGLYPVGGYADHRTPAFQERQYITAHLTSLGRDPRLDALMRKYDTHYVYFGDDTISRFSHAWTLAQLRAVPRLREVFHRPGAHVFEVLPRTTPGT